MKRIGTFLVIALVCGLCLKVCAARVESFSGAINVAGTGAPLLYDVPQEAEQAPQSVREQIKLLQSANPAERAMAACELGEMGAQAKAAIPALIQILGDDAPVDQVDCGRRGNFHRKNKWNGIDKTSPGEIAAVGLSAIGQASVEPLITAARSDKAHARANALFALGLLKGARTVEPLIAGLKDADKEVRARAAWGLGLKQDERVVLPLVETLRDSEAKVREQSAWALGLQGDERSVEPLLNALRDAEASVREQAAWALGLKGDERSVEALNAALTDQSSDVREQAAWALGLKGDERSVEPLIAALKDTDADVRSQSAWALGLRHDERAVDPLMAALQDTDRDVREQAKWALGLLDMQRHPLVRPVIKFKYKGDKEKDKSDPERP
ncbi:MAG: HEAT repeat domain-containing protein [Pyrinomonadaceae bacterium]